MNKVVVAVVIRNGQVLITRRREREGNLHWQFPGGALQARETAAICAEREVFEETDIGCRARHIMGERVHPDTRRTVSYVLCEYLRGEPLVKEAHALDRAQWMNPPDTFRLITTDIFPPIRRLLGKLG